MIEPASWLVCSGCGASPPVTEAFPFRCPNHGSGDVDHVLRRQLDLGRVHFPDSDELAAEKRTFVSYRHLLHSYHRAVAGGIPDEAFVELVCDLDEKVAAVDGHGFSPTPFSKSELLSKELGLDESGGVFVKDETGNVAGSHKARHMMGILLHLEIAELLGLSSPAERRRLAIASCGNAALAAAVVTAAAGRMLEVFVPPEADERIVSRLNELEAEVVMCRRGSGERGDPTYARLLEALEGGALAFSCQGNLNGLAIEGGETLGYEIAASLRSEGEELDHLVVQVGGGALASSCVQALSEAMALGVISRMPRIHTVQTNGAHPLERAYHLVGEDLAEGASDAEVDVVLRAAAARRSHYMWPWEEEPKSIASGILDDETYDWFEVVRGMLLSGGVPVVVSEEQLGRANELAQATGWRTDPTGSSSLAGLLGLLDDGTIAAGDRVAVLFTGVER